MGRSEREQTNDLYACLDWRSCWSVGEDRNSFVGRVALFAMIGFDCRRISSWPQVKGHYDENESKDESISILRIYILTT